jgi:hypothetical protein
MVAYRPDSAWTRASVKLFRLRRRLFVLGEVGRRELALASVRDLREHRAGKRGGTTRISRPSSPVADMSAGLLSFRCKTTRAAFVVYQAWRAVLRKA